MFTQPLDLNGLYRKQKGLRRELAARDGLRPLRVGMLAGSSGHEVADLLELFLLDAGFRPVIHQAEYGRFYEESVLDSSALEAFHPDVVLIYTSTANLRGAPPVGTDEAGFERAIRDEMARFEAVWDAIDAKLGCQIIQNDFEPPSRRIFGNLDASALFGFTHFVTRMNLELARAARARSKLLIHDLASLAAVRGLSTWLDETRWHAYKIVTTPPASVEVAHSIAALIGAMYGRTRKCLVLDLDNTLWGGVIGDDGVGGIQLGRETAAAEGFTAFQEYCKRLRDRGVLLAVCSKNDEENARAGLAHPSSVLKADDFSAFKANWDPKHENLKAIAADLNIGLDSLVFVDDNPAERALVAAQCPEVAVPDVGSDVTRFAAIIDASRLFESVSISTEDLSRADLYRADSARATLAGRFADYGEFLASLAMEAEIEPFSAVYLDRIAQLTNKTNQFNLTTKRYTAADLEAFARSDDHVTLYGRLTDTFGDHGLISVVVGRREGTALHMDLWLMSCRVLKREMEGAMLDALATIAATRGLDAIIGEYRKSAKNGMVAEHYAGLGFELVSRDTDGGSIWRLPLDHYTPRSTHIRRVTRG